jgi:putative IMPACT (imprinted ancient) family translation regulator
MLTDSYQTIASPSEGEYKEKGSKFLAYAYPMDAESDLDGFHGVTQRYSSEGKTLLLCL